MESHLLQMRGLKQGIPLGKTDIMKVASFTDAWIETGNLHDQSCPDGVASFTDAWIET